MSKLRSFAVWVFEMLCEAIGTTAWMAILARIHDGPGFKALIAQLNFPETGRMPSSVDVRK